jgi:predicted DCC family thiol-disulfide oxidoreductase YuxK
MNVGPLASFELSSAALEGDWRGAPGLTVLFDQRCPLCRRLKSWLAAQPTLVPIDFVAAASPEAVRRFPNLDHARTTSVLTVVAANGAVYEAERAWLVCAWALPKWQPLAEQLDTRGRLVLVRAAARLVDRRRHAVMRKLYGQSCERCQIAPPDSHRGGG